MSEKKTPQKISEEEKNVFLQDLEEDYVQELDEGELENEENFEEEKSSEKQKKSYSTAIFASIFVFFIFIVILLIFLLSLADSENPIFRAFGIEGYQIKQFLIGLANKIFMIIVIVLLLTSAVGIFRGYSISKSQPKKRRGSFMFGWVSMGLIFFSVLAWGGVIAFINKFVVNDYNHAQIEMIDAPSGKISAPIDITFSAEELKKEIMYKGDIVRGFRWSKDEGRTYSSSSLNPEYTFQYLSDGVQIVTLEVELFSGKLLEYQRIFLIDDATFITRPERVKQGVAFTVDASGLQNDNAVFLWDFDADGIVDKRTSVPVVKHIYDIRGEKTISLRVESDNGGVKRYSKTFIVHSVDEKTVNAKIFVEDIVGKTPFKVTLDGSGSYANSEKVLKYVWKIEGSRSLEGDVVDYTFVKPGRYDVALEVITESGKTDIEKITIDVEQGNSAPVVRLDTKPKISNGAKVLKGYIPFHVDFYGGKSTDSEENIVQYKWTVDNGRDVEDFFGEHQEYIFRKSGSYDVTLLVSDSGGESSDKKILVEVEEPPVVPVVSLFPSSGTAPLIVDFNASLSTCRLEDCKIISYEWDFNDNTKVLRGGAFTSHQFQSPGNYAVEVTAITNLGDRVTKIVYVTVTDAPLISCFVVSRTSGVVPLTVAFDPTRCSKGDIVRYQWDFGDGYISSKKKTVHTYTDSGVYTAILRVFDKDGRVNEMQEIITVSGNE